MFFDHKVMALATNFLANFCHDSDIPLARSHSLMWLAVEKTLELP